MSDVPFGVFLSGGLDSSTNVALMAELNEGPVRTFSVAPHGYSRYDEREPARLIASRFGAEHHEVLIDDSDLEAFLPQLAYYQDEPAADWTAVPQHFVSRLARETGTIVIQCGEGSDELLHGYNGYVAHRRFAVPFQRLPRPMRLPVGVAIARTTRRVGRGIRHGEALYDAARSPIPYWGGEVCFRGEIKEQVLVRRPQHDSYAGVERHWADAMRARPNGDLLQRMTYLELLCMANSVEGREPFLDHRLVEFSLALPPRLKHRNGVGKWALRQAMRGILPDEIIDRPKQGFGTPMEEWLRGPFGAIAHAAVRASGLRERGLLNYGILEVFFLGKVC
jgi:asparagine synthase (glutamine-hydrolysing)